MTFKVGDKVKINRPSIGYSSGEVCPPHKKGFQNIPGRIIRVSKIRRTNKVYIFGTWEKVWVSDEHLTLVQDESEEEKVRELSKYLDRIPITPGITVWETYRSPFYRALAWLLWRLEVRTR